MIAQGAKELGASPSLGVAASIGVPVERRGRGGWTGLRLLRGKAELRRRDRPWSSSAQNPRWRRVAGAGRAAVIHHWGRKVLLEPTVGLRSLNSRAHIRPCRTATALIAGRLTSCNVADHEVVDVVARKVDIRLDSWTLHSGSATATRNGRGHRILQPTSPQAALEARIDIGPSLA